MARWANRNWNIGKLPENDCSNVSHSHVVESLLMDLRDELQKLNRVFACKNVQRGFAALERLAAQNEAAFKRRVESAVRKRMKRKG